LELLVITANDRQTEDGYLKADKGQTEPSPLGPACRSQEDSKDTP
jgi:hypothetical protein